MTQTRITAPADLLDRHGHVASPGYATEMMWRYDRKRIHARPFALKEWDFYQVQLGEWILQFTLGHVSYAHNAAVTLLRPSDGKRASFSMMKPFALRGMGASPDRPGVLTASGRGWCMTAANIGEAVRLTARTDDGRTDVQLTLRRMKGDDKMVICTPFDRPNQFYLNSKEHFPIVTGFARIGGVYAEAAEGDTALLDWGRGVWPFRQDWYWGCGSQWQNGSRIGFNIGWGFGDLSRATENMFFVNGKHIKLGRIITDMDEKALDRPWHFRDEDGLLDMVMQPVYDNFTTTKILWVDNSCHQVYGTFAGVIRTEEGEIVFDGLEAFVEHARNRW